MTRARVHLLDDNDAFRTSTGWLLESLDYEAVLHAEPAEAVPRLLEEALPPPSCLLLDMRMPGMSGLDVHDALLGAGCDMPVVYLTGHGDVPLAVSAMRKGAFTFLQKPLDADVLADVLADALSAEVQNVRGNRSTQAEVSKTRELLARLSARELQIVRGMVEGRTTREMSETLHLSVKTVELYRSRAMKRLDARNAAHLVRLVMSCDAR